MNRLTEIRSRLAELQPQIVALAEADTLTEEQDESLRSMSTEWESLTAEAGRLEQRAALAESVRSASIPTVREPGDGVRAGAPAVHVQRDAFSVLEDRSVQGRDRTRALADGLLRANEARIERGADQSNFERIVKRHAGDHRWAEGMLARSRDVYADAFSKVVTGREVMLDAEERAALAIGTTTQGGYLVPTHLDPTIILTNDGSSNIMRAAGTRKVTLTEGNVWYGVTSAGSTASWDGELTEVSDDSPTVAQATITCYKAQAFVQASVEAFQDVSGLASDVLMILGDAKDRLEGAAHMTGSGSAPQGLFTLVNASTTLQTVTTTAATIGLVDIHALYKSLPVRWRGRGTFVAHPLWLLKVKELGTAVSASYSGDLSAPVTERILGRPVLESDDAPSTQTTTAKDQAIIFADLGQYTIVDKPGGTSVELIPHLFNTANNLPDGRRGWYMRWRTGAGMPALAAGRVLVDKTSA